MIVSASRRTDIPAFYGEWLLARLRAGEALVRSPFDARKVTRVDLRPGAVDCIVLWTKDPGPFLPLLPGLEPHPYYFQFTLNPYGPPLEPGLPEAARRVDVFRELSRRLGPLRVVWRYDPVILSPATPPEYHLEQFDRLSEQLASHTETCVVSFLDLYAKIRRRTAPWSVREAGAGEMRAIARGFADIARGRGMAVESCCEPVLSPDCGVVPGRCIDPGRISRIIGRPFSAPRHRGQRPACGCAQSVDIGAYDTCGHGCLYCYANAGPDRVGRNRSGHDPAGPMLTGRLLPGRDLVTGRKPDP